CASGYPACSPAPASNTTSSPAFASSGTTAGVRATRRSPGYISLGTPTITGLVLLRLFLLPDSASTSISQCFLTFPSAPQCPKVDFQEQRNRRDANSAQDVRLRRRKCCANIIT